MSCQVTAVERESQHCPGTDTNIGSRYCDTEGVCPFNNRCRTERELKTIAAYHVRQRMEVILSSGDGIDGFSLHEALMVATSLTQQETDAGWERSLAAVTHAAQAFAAHCEECIHACIGRQLGDALRQRNSLEMHTVRSGNLVVSFIRSETMPSPDVHPAGTGRVTLRELEKFERNVLNSADLPEDQRVIDMAISKINRQIRQASI